MRGAHEAKTLDHRQEIANYKANRSNLPEDGLMIGAVSLLLLSSLQNNDGVLGDIFTSPKSLTQSLPVQSKQLHGHAQALRSH